MRPCVAGYGTIESLIAFGQSPISPIVEWFVVVLCPLFDPLPLDPLDMAVYYRPHLVWELDSKRS